MGHEQAENVHLADEKSLDYDAFVSYNSHDEETVLPVCDHLRRCGLNLWIDHDQLFGGDDWREGVAKGIASSKAAVIFLGPSGIGDSQGDELSYVEGQCLSHKVPMIPVLLPGVKDKDVPKRRAFEDRRRVVFKTSTDEPKTLGDLVRSITRQKPKRPLGTFEIHVEVPAAEKQCFVAIDGDSLDEWFEPVTAAAQKAGLGIRHACEARQYDKEYTPDVHAAIAPAGLVVGVCCGGADGALDSEVMFELGVARALGKPTILVTDDATKLPPRILGKPALVCETQAADPKAVEAVLLAQMRQTVSRLRFPYLIDNDLEGITVMYSDLTCIRSHLWERLRTILLFGIDVHHHFRDIVKQGHALQRQVDEAFENLRRIAPEETRNANWAGILRSHEEFRKYHLAVENQLLEFLDDRKTEVLAAYDYLLRATKSEGHEDEHAHKLIDDSRTYCGYACSALKGYLGRHGRVCSTLEDEGSDLYTRIAALQPEVAALSIETERVETHGYDMMTRLLEVISK